MSNQVFEPDEFDELGQGLPVGTHRPAPPWWHGLLPWIIIVLVAPLLAWAMFLLIGSRTPVSSLDEAGDNEATQVGQVAEGPKVAQVDPGSPDAASNQSPKPSESTSGQEPKNSPEPTAEKTESPAVADLDKSVKITVSNASGVSGLAGSAKSRIAAKGFSDITANNYQGQAPRKSTVYFSEGQGEVAKELQAILDIDLAVERDNLSTPIVVVLTSSFK